MRNIRYGLGILLVFIGLATLAALFASVRLHRADKDVFRTYESRYNSYLLADELRQSSDDLTRFARTYVNTDGEQRWADSYQAVLDIRNGVRPRPAHYERIYWELDDKQVHSSKAGGEALSLRQRLLKARISPGEMAKLDTSLRESNQLTDIERRSMAMMRGAYPDREGARRLLYDASYMRAKARILRPIDEFYTLLLDRTQAQVEAARDAQALWQRLAIGLVALVMIAVLFGGYMIAGLLRQLGAEPSGAIRIASQIAAGDHDVAVPLQPGDHDSLLYHMKEMADQLRAAEERQREYAEQLKQG